MRQLRCSRALAFTLVELLVVIGIIAVLVSILLPSLNKARQQARTVACLSNLHQIGIAIQMYANDNRQFLPASKQVTGGAAHWKFEIAPYIKKAPDYVAMMTKDEYWGAKGPFGCPDWAGVSANATCQAQLNAHPGYFGGLGWSAYISVDGETSREKITRVRKNGQESALVGDVVDISQWDAGATYTDYIYLYSIGAYPVDKRIARRHKKGLNILWADMHADNQSQAFMAAGKNGVTGYYYNIH